MCVCVCVCGQTHWPGPVWCQVGPRFNSRSRYDLSVWRQCSTNAAGGRLEVFRKCYKPSAEGYSAPLWCDFFFYYFSWISVPAASVHQKEKQKQSRLQSPALLIRHQMLYFTDPRVEALYIFSRAEKKPFFPAVASRKFPETRFCLRNDRRLLWNFTDRRQEEVHIFPEVDKSKVLMLYC